MANQNKQNQSAQRQVNDYEKIRLLRIEENKKKNYKNWGVKRIANSLTSLVDSQKIKKIVKPINTKANDVDYIPVMGDHSDGDHQQVATRSKKKHHPRYIAPLSMNKFANIAKKHRVIGPKVSQKFPLDSNATKENQSRVSMTMAELISRDNGVEMELDGLKCDENEGEYLKFQDDEYEDMDDMTFVDNEKEIQMDDSEDDLENEDDVQIQEQLQDSELKNKTAISESKKRRPTMLHLVHTRKVDDREVIICNEFGQPVGPVTKEKDVVGRFSRFLGTIARNHSYAPLIYNSWHKVPHKYKIWEYVLKRCLRAKEIRMSQKNMHTAGPKSFARIRDEMKNDNPNNELPTLTQMFEHTRKRTEGRIYVDTYDDTRRKIEQMKKYKSSENESDLIDPFMAVMHKENSGYCRLYGRGVTNKLIKKRDGGDTTYTVPGGLMESFNASFEGQKNQLLEMKKDLDEEHERKKAELEAIQHDIKTQREHLEATMQKLMKQLPHEN
ncbi:hypothetical protein R6Q59_023970 [Mikania micrantha]